MTAIAVVVGLLILVNIVLHRTPESVYVPLSILASLVFLGVGRLVGLTWADLGLSPTTLVSGALWGALLVVLVGIVYLVGASIPRTRRLFGDRRAIETRGVHIARRALIDVPFGTVLLEETAFRGVLYALIVRRENTTWAIIGTSVLFGLWHILPALPMHDAHDAIRETIGTGMRARITTVTLTVIGTGLGGVVFALLRWWTNSLLPPVGLHWALNGLGLAFAWTIGRWIANTESLFERHDAHSVNDAGRSENDGDSDSDSGHSDSGV